MERTWTVPRTVTFETVEIEAFVDDRDELDSVGPGDVVERHLKLAACAQIFQEVAVLVVKHNYSEIGVDSVMRREPGDG